MFNISSKTLSAIAAAAAIAGVLTIFAAASDQVSASSPLNSGKSDRLDIRTADVACAGQAWPNFDAACLKDRRAPMGQAKTVRVVTAERNAR